MSNETPRANLEKTRSGLRLLVLLLLGAATIAIGWALAANDPQQTSGPFVKLSGHQLQADIANNEVERIQGLSGRESMAANKGMLFVFDADEQHCIWMKDMRFPIDILWLDGDGNVVDLAEKVAPETFPNQFCNTNPARYVFEVNAGTVERLGVEAGDQTIIRY